MTHKKAQKSSSFGAWIVQSAIGTGISFAVSILLTVLSALICTRFPDPLSATAAVGTGISFLCYLLAGILSVRRNDGSILLSGLFPAIMLSLLLLAVGWMTDGSFPPPFGWLLMLLGMAFSVAGAYLARSRNASRRSRRPHSHRR